MIRDTANVDYMTFKTTILILAACACGALTCSAYSLVLCDADGSERLIRVADGMTMTVEGDNLIINSPDERVLCELSSLHGFRYVNTDNPASVPSIADNCQVTIGSDCVTVTVGNRNARCEIIDMSGLVALDRHITGQEIINFNRFHQGIYVIRIDGMTMMKFAVK